MRAPQKWGQSVCITSLLVGLKVNKNTLSTPLMHFPVLKALMTLRDVQLSNIQIRLVLIWHHKYFACWYYLLTPAQTHHQSEMAASALSLILLQWEAAVMSRSSLFDASCPYKCVSFRVCMFVTSCRPLKRRKRQKSSWAVRKAGSCGPAEFLYAFRLCSK